MRNSERSFDGARGTFIHGLNNVIRGRWDETTTTTTMQATRHKWRWRAQLTTIALSAARQERGGKIDDREREMSARDVIEGSDRIGSDRGIDSGRAPSYNS